MNAIREVNPHRRDAATANIASGAGYFHVAGLVQRCQMDRTIGSRVPRLSEC